MKTVATMSDLRQMNLHLQEYERFKNDILLDLWYSLVFSKDIGYSMKITGKIDEISPLYLPVYTDPEIAGKIIQEYFNQFINE